MSATVRRPSLVIDSWLSMNEEMDRQMANIFVEQCWSIAQVQRKEANGQNGRQIGFV